MELMLDPGMDPSLVHRWCKMINTLIRKLELISGNDFIIDWKPIFKLYERLEPSKDQFHVSIGVDFLWFFLGSVL
jgi:hypothetical protein